MIKLYTSKQWLTLRYKTQGKTAEEIAAECNVRVSTIYNYLKDFGLSRGR